MSLSDDHHFKREDRSTRWVHIADHIRRHPEDLSIVLANLGRWEAWGRVHPAPIKEWRQRISAALATSDGMQELLDFLAAPNHDSEPIKSCSPFVGLPIDAPARP